VNESSMRADPQPESPAAQARAGHYCRWTPAHLEVGAFTRSLLELKGVCRQLRSVLIGATA